MEGMDLASMNAEILECARYGEHEELEEFLKAGAEVNFMDAQGNTAMHKAAANGEIKCLKVLKEYGATHKSNSQGNLPIHWAAQNLKKESLVFLIDAYDSIDMLERNNMGISTLTDAFQSGDVDIIEICLSHPSASEEKLIDTNSKAAIVKMEDDDDDGERSDSNNSIIKGTGEVNEADEDAIEVLETNAVTHNMDLLVAGTGSKGQKKRLIKVRELPISRADNPFGSESAPEDDTTGLAIWPASIILSRWIGRIGQVKPEMMAGKSVIELGAGCGLPGLAAAMLCHPAKVYITDIHHSTLENAVFNVRLNGKASYASEAYTSATKESGSYGSIIIDPISVVIPDPIVDGVPMEVEVAGEVPSTVFRAVQREEEGVSVECLTVNWMDPATFPPGGGDLLLGSDLVYDKNILDCLVPAVKQMLRSDGSFLYCAPDSGRDGMTELIAALARVDILCVEHTVVPDYMYGNPLCGVDEDYFVLHFYDLAAKQPHSLYHFKHAADTIGYKSDTTVA